MKTPIKHIIFLSLICFIVFINTGCKEPTDLGGNVIIEPKAAIPILKKDISLSFNGSGKFLSFGSKGPDNFDWNLKSFSIDSIRIDTSSANTIVISFEGEGTITSDIVNDQAQCYPTNISVRIDSLRIPIIQSDPMMPLSPQPILLDKAELEMIVNNRKMVNGRLKIETQRKKLSLKERDNYIKSHVSAISYIPKATVTGKGEITLFIQIMASNIEVMNDNRRENAIISGQTAIKCKW